MSEVAEQQQRKSALHLPLRKLISPRLWKHLLLGLAGVGVAAGLLWAGKTASGEHPYGPGFGLFFSLSTGHAVQYYNAAMLTIAGQLCLLIWWARSHSRKDFSGSYRVWFWSAAACLVSAFVAVTDAHVAWSQTALWLWDVDVWNKQTLSWLVPIGVPAAVFYLLLQRDTRDCRVSVNLLRLSSLAMLGAALWTLGFRLPEHELLAQYPLPEDLVEAGLPMFGCFCLMFGLLLHSRYVVYETPEPPATRPSLLRKLFGRRGDQSGGQDESRTKSRRGTTTGEKAPAPSTRRKTSARRTKRKAAANEADDSSTDAGDEDASGGRSSSDKSDRQHWIDGPIDPAQLKGLSKRERRRVRKQWREQQRAETGE